MCLRQDSIDLTHEATVSEDPGGGDGIAMVYA